MQTDICRVSVPISFSREFESMLLSYPTDHISLTHDIEAAVKRGLEHFDELEDVIELQHKHEISLLVKLANRHLKVESQHFSSWHIGIQQDLLDEVELIKILHGDDLVEIGLKSCETSVLIVFLAIAGTIN